MTRHITSANARLGIGGPTHVDPLELNRRYSFVTHESDDVQSSPFVGRGGLLVVVSGERLLALCASQGWSLSELAALAKISRPTLRSALRGRPVRPRTAWKLARAVRECQAQPTLDDLLRAA